MEYIKVTVPKLPADAKAIIQPKEDAARRTTQQALDDTTKRQLNGDATGYFKASWVGGRWQIGRRLPNQDW
jgi:hypothetical protein